MKITDRQKTEPVTTIVQHEILEGREADFEAWSEKIRSACRKYDGYLGTEVIKPVEGDKNNYVCIFRFDSFNNLEVWMDSAERKTIVAEAGEFSARGPHYHQYQSLEFLFTGEGAGAKPPSREKMAFVTYLGLIPPVYFIPPLITEYVTGNAFLGTLASLGIITPMMVYMIMPILTKIAAKWLYR